MDKISDKKSFSGHNIYLYKPQIPQHQTNLICISFSDFIHSLSPSPHSCYCPFLLHFAGSVAFLLDENIDQSLLQSLCSRFCPQYIYAPKSSAAKEVQGKEIDACANYVLSKTDFAIDYTLHDDLALLLTTSGSTGSPKLVRQSHQNIDSNASAIAQYLGITRDERAITTMPMQYTYGLSIIHSHLLMGATIVLNEASLMEKRFWERLKAEDVRADS